MLAFKSSWVRRVLFVCWLPIIIWGVCVFVIEGQMEFQPQGEAAANQYIEVQNSIRDLAQDLEEQIDFENDKEIEVPPEVALVFAMMDEKVHGRGRDPRHLRHEEDAIMFAVTVDGKKIDEFPVSRRRLKAQLRQLNEVIDYEIAEELANPKSPQARMSNEFLRFVEEDLPVLPRVDILREKLSSGTEGAFRDNNDHCRDSCQSLGLSRSP